MSQANTKDCLSVFNDKDGGGLEENEIWVSASGWKSPGVVDFGGVWRQVRSLVFAAGEDVQGSLGCLFQGLVHSRRQHKSAMSGEGGCIARVGFSRIDEGTR